MYMIRLRLNHDVIFNSVLTNTVALCKLIPEHVLQYICVVGLVETLSRLWVSRDVLEELVQDAQACGRRMDQ